MHHIIRHGAFGENQCLRNTLIGRHFAKYRTILDAIQVKEEIITVCNSRDELKIVYSPYVREQSLAKG